MKRYESISAGELRKRHGQRVRFETNGDVSCYGTVSVDKNGRVYLAHDNPRADGSRPADTMGHKYGWCIYRATSIEPDDTTNNRGYHWIEFLAESEDGTLKTPPADRAHIAKTIWSDGVEINHDGTLTIDGVTKSRDDWTAYAKQIRRALERKEHQTLSQRRVSNAS